MGMIHWLTINNPSNPQQPIPYVKRTSEPPFSYGFPMVSVEDLVFTSREDPGSVDLAVALAAEHWPETDPDDAWRRN